MACRYTSYSCKGRYEDELEELVREKFDADELNWIGGNNALETLGYWTKGIKNNDKLVLSVWWD